MQRISVPWILDVVMAVDGLANLASGNTYGQIWGYAYSARTQLEALFNQSLYVGSLTSSRQSANELYETLGELLAADHSAPVTDIHLYLASHRRERFRTVFLAELGTLPCYFVSPKPPYDTEMLLDAGETLMPEGLAVKVPEAVFDAKESARALAFQLPTASGFHSFRCLESVVRRYYKEVTSGRAEPKQRNLGVYIRALTNSGGDPKVIATLSQLKDLHRNPLAHPEVALKQDEAITIAGLARSAVSAMLAQLPEPPLTTTTAVE